MWEFVLFIVAVIIIISALFVFGMKLKKQDGAHMKKYFRPRH